MKDKINAILINSDWTLERLAQELNVPVELVSSWVNDDVKPDPSIQVVIDDLYNTMIKCMEEWMRAPYKMRYIIIDLNRLLDAKEAEDKGYYSRLQAHLHEIQDSLEIKFPDKIAPALGTILNLITLEKVEGNTCLGFISYDSPNDKPLGVVSAYVIYALAHTWDSEGEIWKKGLPELENALKELDQDIYSAFAKIKECCPIDDFSKCNLHQEDYYEDYLLLKENNMEEFNKLSKRLQNAIIAYKDWKGSFKDLGIIQANYLEYFGGRETIFLMFTPMTDFKTTIVEARDLMFKCLIEGHPWEHYYPEYRERINKIRKDNNDIIYD
jgi:hypothetical protein